MELVIAGNVLLDDKLNKCCIGIERGRIKAIKKVLKGDRILDFGDKLVLPAGIDIHVHFRDPGMTQKEDFETGSTAAAFGGIGCVMDMPNTIPPVTDIEALKDKLNIVRRKSCIDFGLYSAVTARSDLAGLAPLSTGFKLYLGETTGNLTYNNMSELMTKLKQIPENYSRVMAVHAEDATELLNGKKAVDDDKNKSLKAHSKRRPEKAETAAINDLLEFYNDVKGRNIKLHFSHLTSISSPELLGEYDEISSEVTPHHMFLSTDDFKGPETYGKVNPPVRTASVRNALWNAFISGEIPIVASDHAPHTLDEKEEAFADAPSGMPGVETMMPLLLSRLKHGQIGLERLVDATAVQPARLFGLNKGRIVPGLDADIMVVDMKAETALKTTMLHSKCGWTPYEKKQVIFPSMTLSRGNIVVKNGGFEGEPGQGRFIELVD